MNIYEEIKAERDAQDQKWGGRSHDDEHDGLDWLDYILQHAAKALSGVVRAERGQGRPSDSTDHDRRWVFTVTIPPAQERDHRIVRKQLVRVAALAVAAVESFSRRNRVGVATPGHLIDDEFQSDKYPTTPRGKVPLSVKDPTAQDLLWEYAQRRRVVDPEFSDDLETALRTAGFTPTANAERQFEEFDASLKARAKSISGLGTGG